MSENLAWNDTRLLGRHERCHGERSNHLAEPASDTDRLEAVMLSLHTEELQ
ncbi:MAG: hypothetical protein RBT62_08445 [Spirochaetia bacterium]|nr:hypothetical protein [Spirochaetia bacterium]